MMSLMSFRLVAFFAAAALLVGCDKPPAAGTGPGPGGGETPPPEVSVVTARSEAAPIVREQVGRLAATRVAQVRARVAGIILKRVYTEGTDVEQGDVLFEIDPAQLEAKLNAAEASLAKAEADALNAAETAKRYTELRQKKTISQQDVDTAVASERATAAAVLEARAKVASARLDLGYATVRAPISGRAGRALVTEGALVGQSDATLLTTVEQIDPIYINFSQSVAEVEALARLGGGARWRARDRAFGRGPAAQRHALSRDRKDELLRPGGRPEHRRGVAARDLAQPATGAAARHVRHAAPDRG